MTVKVPKSVPWTDEEDEHLRAVWKTKPRVEIALELNRTADATSTRAHKLGLGNGLKSTHARSNGRTPWTDEEDERLRLSWKTKSLKEIALGHNRSVAAINIRACKIGLSKCQTKNGRPKGTTQIYCKHGHLLEKGNVYFSTDKSGRTQRQCRTCNLEHVKKRYQPKNAA